MTASTPDPVETLAKVIYDAEGFHAADSWALETSINRDRCASYATAVLAAIDAGRVPGLGRVDAAKAESCDVSAVVAAARGQSLAEYRDECGGSRMRWEAATRAALAAAPASQPTDAPLVALVREYADRHAITLPSEPGPDRRVVDVDELAEWLQGRDVVDREALGRLVREVWVTWAREQPDPKPSWLVGWDDLPEPDREVDRRIGEALYRRGALDTRRATASARDPLEGDLTVEWGVLGDEFSPQPSRETAERTVERLRTGKMRVANRHVAWRYVSAPRRALLPDAATEGGA